MMALPLTPSSVASSSGEARHGSQREPTPSATVNQIYARHTPDPPPARSAPATAALPRGLLVSIEAVAALPE
jgi:enamine deaminase RidA (YjgF/YER057c/UK114 family)